MEKKKTSKAKIIAGLGLGAAGAAGVAKIIMDGKGEGDQLAAAGEIDGVTGESVAAAAEQGVEALAAESVAESVAAGAATAAAHIVGADQPVAESMVADDTVAGAPVEYEPEVEYAVSDDSDSEFFEEPVLASTDVDEGEQEEYFAEEIEDVNLDDEILIADVIDEMPDTGVDDSMPLFDDSDVAIMNESLVDEQPIDGELADGSVLTETLDLADAQVEEADSVEVDETFDAMDDTDVAEVVDVADGAEVEVADSVEAEVVEAVDVADDFNEDFVDEDDYSNPTDYDQYDMAMKADIADRGDSDIDNSLDSDLDMLMTDIHNLE